MYAVFSMAGAAKPRYSDLCRPLLSSWLEVHPALTLSLDETRLRSFQDNPPFPNYRSEGSRTLYGGDTYVEYWMRSWDGRHSFRSVVVSISVRIIGGWGESRCAGKKYVTSFWDEGRDYWIMEKGGYDVLARNSSRCDVSEGVLMVDETTRKWWTGRNVSNLASSSNVRSREL